MPRLKKRKGPFVYKVRKRKPSCEKKVSDVDQHNEVHDSSKTIFNHDHAYVITDAINQDHTVTDSSVSNCIQDHDYYRSTDTCNIDNNTDSDVNIVCETRSSISSCNVYGNSSDEPVSDDAFHASDSCRTNCNFEAINENECYSHVEDDIFIDTCMLDACNDNSMLDACNDNSEVMNKFQVLKKSLKHVLFAPYCFHPSSSSETIEIVEMYPTSDKSSVKLIVIIDQEFCAKIFVHRIQIQCDHDFWTGLPARFDTTSAVLSLLSKLLSYSVCVGNFDDDFQNLVPIGSAINHSDCNTNTGYREGDFHAKCGNTMYNSTIRSTKCQLLVFGSRCGPCSKIRTVLRSRKNRLKEKQQQRESACDSPNYLSRSFRHCNMSKEDLIGKIYQQKSIISDLEKTVGQLKRRFEQEVACKGVDLDPIQDLEMKDLLSSCRDDVEKSFPNEQSYQRLFWNEQLKRTKCKSSRGMRWHPMIIRWCLYLRHKSSATYDALRDSGFISLPSSRTLFDYSHYIKSALGFQPDAINVLKSEVTKKGMDSEPWKSHVGILFDEIKIKSDLVYDKHTGELIGFCNLDDVGNQILQLERLQCTSDSSRNSELAKFMLVLMVRGIAADLKYPLAGFATNSVTADFLYPILWKACRILERCVKLKVLFFTCDGASANRKFFNMHSYDNFVHYTVNPHDKSRKIYFISDVPHLIKTTRNCFANSYSHKNTRKLWKNGKDISWLHILRLYEDHCELGMYNPCPKLSRSHVDLTAFSYMKVNLAAQVLSSTVANALELMYDDNIAETVNFIRLMNKFFDCLNVRSIFEGRNKRNENLKPYTSIDDNRLLWLTNDFLHFFSQWEESVKNRPGEFTVTQKNGMMLSKQTLQGLKITVHSIVACVNVLLNDGAKFVLTSVFNQDPLEEQFGHYRHHTGNNCNPTAYDVQNTMTQMRTIGAQALALRNGNCKRHKENRVIDNHPLPRRGKVTHLR